MNNRGFFSDAGMDRRIFAVGSFGVDMLNPVSRRKQNKMVVGAWSGWSSGLGDMDMG